MKLAGLHPIRMPQNLSGGATEIHIACQSAGCNLHVPELDDKDSWSRKVFVAIATSWSAPIFSPSQKNGFSKMFYSFITADLVLNCSLS